MTILQDQQSIHQLEKRQGGYFYLRVPAAWVHQFENKRNTRLLCTLEGQLTFACGLNHLGDGDYYIILSRKNLQTIGKLPGDTVAFVLQEDPNPLGVAMPEVLEVLLAQDESLHHAFSQLSLGKKRSVIHTLNKIKDLDKKIQKALQLIPEEARPKKKKAGY